jgi:hypothetical protein
MERGRIVDCTIDLIIVSLALPAIAVVASVLSLFAYRSHWYSNEDLFLLAQRKKVFPHGLRVLT